MANSTFMKLKKHYGLIRDIGFAAVIALVITAFTIWPRFEHTVAHIDNPIIHRIDTFIVQTSHRIIRPLRPVPPVIDINLGNEVEEDPLLDLQLEQLPWELNDPFEQLVLRRSKYLDSSEFVPFYKLEKKPTIIGGWKSLQKAIRYPKMALQAGIEGTVFLEVIIDLKGIPTINKVLKSTPNMGFESAAEEAVLRQRFTPAIQRDRPVKVKLVLPIKFRIAS